MFRKTVWPFRAVFQLALIATAGYLMAQTLHDKIFVDLPVRALIANTVLEPGRYEFREVSESVIRVFKDDERQVEAAVITIPTEDNRPAEETKLVLSKFGDDQQYVSKVWVQGRSTGYELIVPDRVKSIERERASADADGDVEGDAVHGKQVFTEFCQTCHDAESDVAMVGPGLKGLFNWPAHKLSDGTEHEKHDEELIRKQIVEGGGAMPPMGDSISEDALADLMAYLRTL